MSRFDDYQNRVAMIALAHQAKGPKTSPPVMVTLDQIREYAEIHVVPGVYPQTWDVAGYDLDGNREVIVDCINSKAVAEAWVRHLADMVVVADIARES
jgi:hypothetical protein